mgnify:FL=1
MPVVGTICLSRPASRSFCLLVLVPVVILIVAPIASAALPPLSPEERDEQATLIVTGRVVASRTMTLRKPTETVTFVRLAAEIESIAKGADALPALAAAPATPAKRILEIRCRRIERETPGPHGHDEIPAEGSRFTMWLRQNPASDPPQWEPLEPNGIELLDNSPAMTFPVTSSPPSPRDYLVGGLIGIAGFLALVVFLWRRRAIR